jgi:hypothetical protein
MFVVWPHGKETLQEFLCHLNSIQNNISFTMELEESETLPFLDVLVRRRMDGKLSHTVFRKPTHTDLYLHVDSEHHPAQKKQIYPSWSTMHVPYVMMKLTGRNTTSQSHSRKMITAVEISS